MDQKISLSLILKKINLPNLIKKYNSGNVIINSEKKIEVKSSNKLLDDKIFNEKYTSDRNCHTFNKMNKNGNEIVIIGDSQSDLEFYLKTGKLSCGGRCEFCLSDITNSHIGRPEKYLNKNGKEYFYLVGRFCSFECSLGSIYRDYSISHDSKYLTIIENLRRLFFLNFSDKEELTSAPNPRFLKSNGGHMERKEWLSKEHSNLIYSDEFYCIQSRCEYVKK